MKPSLVEVQIDLDGIAFTIQGYYTPFMRGRYSGPPENCFPDEPAEFEVQHVWYHPTDGGDKMYLSEELLAALDVDMKGIEDKALERAERMGEDD